MFITASGMVVGKLFWSLGMGRGLVVFIAVSFFFLFFLFFPGLSSALFLLMVLVLLVLRF
jgi:hypothetical protein